MIDRLTRIAMHHHRRVLAGAAALTVAGLAMTMGLTQNLSLGGFTDPSSESAQTTRLIEERFPTSRADVALVVSASTGEVDDPAVVEAGTKLFERVAALEGVAGGMSYWSDRVSLLRSDDGNRALVVLSLAGDQDARTRTAADVLELATELDQRDPAIDVRPTGPAAVAAEMNEIVERDLIRGESIALPLTFAMMLLVFGGMRTALLPFGVGLLSVSIALLSVQFVSQYTEVSVFALNVTTALGLGLGIDYSLLIVMRFRDEWDQGRGLDATISATMATAGQAAVKSAVLVGVSLFALVAFPLAFLRSFAIAGAAVVFATLFGTLLVVPALLKLFGPHVAAHGRRRNTTEGRWQSAVRRRPGLVAIGGTAVLAMAAIPFFRVQLDIPDERALPASAETRQGTEQVRTSFTSREADAIPVVVLPDGARDVPPATIEHLARTASSFPAVFRVDAATGSYASGDRLVGPSQLHTRFAASGASLLSVIPTLEATSADLERTTRSLRAVDSSGTSVMVGGAAGELLDATDAITSRGLPVVVGIVVTTLLALAVMFRSILVPVKALALNVLSLAATFGALVWVFQDGHLAWLLGFTPRGAVAVTLPFLLFCISFGLSMDYEVFLLSRVREAWDDSGDNTTAVFEGLGRSRRVITTAALLMAIVFAGLVSSSVSYTKSVGLGLLLAVVTDAFLVRTTIAPALMLLAGRANWWWPSGRQTVAHGVVLSPPNDM